MKQVFRSDQQYGALGRQLELLPFCKNLDTGSPNQFPGQSSGGGDIRRVWFGG